MQRLFRWCRLFRLLQPKAARPNRLDFLPGWHCLQQASQVMLLCSMAYQEVELRMRSLQEQLYWPPLEMKRSLVPAVQTTKIGHVMR